MIGRTLLTLCCATLCFGCTRTPPAATDASSAAPSGNACEDAPRAAQDEVQPVLEAHRACSADADCVVIPNGTSCFDSCTTVIAKEGATVVQAAYDHASATKCGPFTQAGCKVIPPPCAPPQPPRCQAGRCI